MKKNTPKEDKLCAILHTISSVLFLLSGILCFISKNNMQGVTYCSLSVCFGSLATLYYKKYKNTK